MAGETVLDGFVDFSLPVNLRRAITMLPGVIVILVGIDPMNALVLSQVSLSFVLPVAIIPMLIITSKRKYMNEFTNKRWVNAASILVTSMIVIFNFVLLYFTFSGNVGA